MITHIYIHILYHYRDTTVLYSEYSHDQLHLTYMPNLARVRILFFVLFFWISRRNFALSIREIKAAQD